MPDSHIQAPPAAISRLREAFTSADVDAGALRDAIYDYVDAMKRLGASVERIIVEIKRVAELEDGPLYRAAMRKDADAQRQARKLLDEAVKWTIDRYFGGGSTKRRES